MFPGSQKRPPKSKPLKNRTSVTPKTDQSSSGDRTNHSIPRHKVRKIEHVQDRSTHIIKSQLKCIENPREKSIEKENTLIHQNVSSLSPDSEWKVRRKRAQETPVRAVQKDKKPAAPPKKARLQVIHIPSKLTTCSLPSKPFEKSSALSQDLPKPQWPIGRKRRYNSETGLLEKRPLLLSQSELKPSHPLSKANLRAHNQLTRSCISDNMSSDFDTLKSGKRKRATPKCSTTGNRTRDTASACTQRSSHTAAHYRWVVLNRARIRICFETPPMEIQSQINSVIHREILEDRKRELYQITRELCDGFAKILNGANREDDCVKPIHQALSLMDCNEKFLFTQKADWNPSLKPRIKPGFWGWNFQDPPHDEADDSAGQSRKRQQTNTTYVPSDTSSSIISSTSPPPNLDSCHVKTPRPDITVGLRHITVVEALMSRGFSKTMANDFLEALQREQVIYSNPTQQALPIRFPSITVEGKSYATGKPIFEAQNQAAVSGGCMINLQLMLAEFVDKVPFGSHSNNACTLAFSICTEGPLLELWVHYTTLEDDIRFYNMSLLKTCHAFLQNEVLEFFMMVNSVMDWAINDFLNDITEQLIEIENANRIR